MLHHGRGGGARPAAHPRDGVLWAEDPVVLLNALPAAATPLDLAAACPRNVGMGLPVVRLHLGSGTGRKEPFDSKARVAADHAAVAAFLASLPSAAGARALIRGSPGRRNAVADVVFNTTDAGMAASHDAADAGSFFSSPTVSYEVTAVAPYVPPNVSVLIVSNLPVHLLKRGVASTLLAAQGYERESVLGEGLGAVAGNVTACSTTLVAQVLAPADDPTLRRLPGVIADPANGATYSLFVRHHERYSGRSGAVRHPEGVASAAPRASSCAGPSRPQPQQQRQHGQYSGKGQGQRHGQGQPPSPPPVQRQHGQHAGKGKGQCHGQGQPPPPPSVQRPPGQPSGKGQGQHSGKDQPPPPPAWPGPAAPAPSVQRQPGQGQHQPAGKGTGPRLGQQGTGGVASARPSLPPAGKPGPLKSKSPRTSTKAALTPPTSPRSAQPLPSPPPPPSTPAAAGGAPPDEAEEPWQRIPTRKEKAELRRAKRAAATGPSHSAGDAMDADTSPLSPVDHGRQKVQTRQQTEALHAPPGAAAPSPSHSAGDAMDADTSPLKPVDQDHTAPADAARDSQSCADDDAVMDEEMGGTQSRCSTGVATRTPRACRMRRSGVRKPRRPPARLAARLAAVAAAQPAAVGAAQPAAVVAAQPTAVAAVPPAPQSDVHMAGSDGSPSVGVPPPVPRPPPSNPRPEPRGQVPAGPRLRSQGPEAGDLPDGPEAECCMGWLQDNYGGRFTREEMVRAVLHVRAHNGTNGWPHVGRVVPGQVLQDRLKHGLHLVTGRQVEVLQYGRYVHSDEDDEDEVPVGQPPPPQAGRSDAGRGRQAAADAVGSGAALPAGPAAAGRRPPPRRRRGAGRGAASGAAAAAPPATPATPASYAAAVLSATATGPTLRRSAAPSAGSQAATPGRTAAAPAGGRRQP